MKYLKFIFLGFGLTILGVILHQTNLQEVRHHLGLVGFTGVALVLFLYLIEFCTDVWAWQLAFNSVPMTLKWTSRLFLIRMVGEAFNRVTPMASLGGEGFKAVLLKSHYQITYAETSTSLIIAKTLNTLSLVIFLAIGLFPLLLSHELSASFKAVTGWSFAIFGCAIIAFVLVQRFRLVSWFTRRVGHTRWGGQVAKLLHKLREVDDQLVEFYSNPKRFSIALFAGFLNWPLSAFEIYCLMRFLDHPIAFSEAWLIDTVAQLVRAITFLVPANVGALEGSLVVVSTAVLGDSAFGLTIAIIRRCKDILWISFGLLIWWVYSLRSPEVDRSSENS